MLTEKEKHILLQVAHDSIIAATKNESPPDLDVDDSILNKLGGAFVTIYVSDQLRGCIGFIEPIFPLIKTIQIAATKASSEDYRFTPIQSNELSDVTVHISIIGEQRKMNSIEDIVIGEDGIIIALADMRGLLLPQVAVEWEWDAKQFLDATCRKAGLPNAAWHDPRAEVILFKVEAFGDRHQKISDNNLSG